MSNTSSLNNLIKDLNLLFKIKSIFILIFSGRQKLLNNIWKWNLDKNIVNKYWRKSDLFNEDSLLCSKYLKNYLDIIKDRIKNNYGSNDMVTVIKNKYVPDECIFSLLRYKNSSSYWDFLIKYRQNIPLGEFINRRSEIKSKDWYYILQCKILTSGEIIEILTGEYYSLEEKKCVLKFQPQVLSVLKIINEYAISFNTNNENMSYQLLITTVNNFYFKLSNGKLIHNYPEFSWNFGWFVGYTVLDEKTIERTDEILLMTYNEVKYLDYKKIFKVRVYWKDLITTISAKKVEIIREINLKNNYNIYKRSNG